MYSALHNAILKLPRLSSFSAPCDYAAGLDSEALMCREFVSNPSQFPNYAV